jgi:hypothetical protein
MQLTSSSKGCRPTIPRLERTVQAAGLEVVDAWECDHRCPVTETVALTSISSAMLRPFFPDDRGRLTGTICRRHGCFGGDWQTALRHSDLGARCLWRLVSVRSLTSVDFKWKTHSIGHSSIRVTGTTRQSTALQDCRKKIC